MDAELTRLLGYLDHDGVTELVLGSGQPVTVRRGGAYTAASTEIVTRPQLARWLLGSGFESLLPDEEGIGEPADIDVGKRRYAVQISRRGEDLLVRVEVSKAPPPPAITARTRSRAIKKPTTSPVMQTTETARPAGPPSKPPPFEELSINPPSVLELGPPDRPAPAPPPTTATPMPDLMPDLPLALSRPAPPTEPPPLRATPTPAPPASAPQRARSEPIREPLREPAQARTPAPFAAPVFQPPDPVRTQPATPVATPVPPALGATPTPTPARAVSRATTEPPSSGVPRMPEVTIRSTGLTRPPEAASGPVALPKTPPAEGPVPRAPRTRSADPVTGAPPPRTRMLRDSEERPNTELIARVVRAARQRGASDLHVAANRPLMIRAIGELIPLDRTVLPPADVDTLLQPLLGSVTREILAQRGYVDIAIDIPEAGRLRGNISRQQGGLKGSFRLAYPQPPTLEELNLPKELAKVVSHHQGLVVFAGPSGHGKTTTLAALVDLINSTRPHHILTIEDPVEIEHPRKRAVVTQREVGRHTRSFAAALKASLREDPDVIVIGELRDRETVEIALTAAETGHLVMATMSTPSAAKTIDRLIDMFPPDDQTQVRASLGGALRAIVAQRLVPRADNGAVLPAVELLTGVLPLVSLIRDNKLYQLPNLMQRGRAFGMIRLDDSLLELVRSGMITEETAVKVADNKRDLVIALRGPLAAATAAAAQPAPPPGTTAGPGGGTAATPAPAAKKGGLGALFGRKDRE